MKERLYLWAWRVIFVYCTFFLMSGVVCGAEEGFDNPYVKQVEITNVDRDGHEQSTLVKVTFNSLPDSVEDLIDYMEFRDSDGEVYQFYPEEFYSIYSYDFYLKELPFSLPDGEIEFTLYDSEGIEYEYLMQQAKDRTAQTLSATYDGKWSGTTNQGYDVSFTVSNDTVTQFKIKVKIYGAYCTATITMTVSSATGWSVSGNSFTITGSSSGTYGCNYTYKGTFNSNTSASGTWYYKDNYCNGSGSGTWQASLKGSEPLTGAMVTSDLWIRAVINTVEKGPIEAVWKKGGEDTTSRGDRVIWGHFYASPSDVTWGSENNPDLFVKIWFDVSGRVDVNFFHVSVPDIEVYSDYPYDGTYDQQGMTTMSRRYIRQYYENGQSYSDENYEDGNPPAGYSPTGNPSGYSTINDLRIGSIINTVEKGSIDALWRSGGQDTTARGDQVVWGHFYASPSDVTWGSQNNPDLFVKIWFDVSGRVDVNFFHVSVPDIEVYSDLPDEGTYDQQGTTIMDNRYIRHEYIKGENSGNVEFCRQVNNYEAGYGVEGVDEIIVTTIQGPEGATVSNQKNGEYIVNGTYKLGTFNTATISLNWGGSTSYSLVEDYEINSAGEGSFTVRVIKESGGSGNLFLSMASGSKWMFDAIPLNTLCSSTLSIGLIALPEVSKKSLDYDTNEDNILVREVPWTYFEK